MLLHSILFLAAYASFTRGSPIIEGNEIEDIREFPYVVHIHLLSYDKEKTIISSLCGGSILSRRHILTAAHCLLSKKKRVYQATVTAGVSNVKGHDLHRPQRRAVKGYRIHKDYKEFKIPFIGKGEFQSHDIAILWLGGDPLILGPTVKVAQLQLDPLKLEGLNGIALGWGLTERHVASDTLRETKLQIISLNECKKYYPENKFKEDKYFCVRDKDTRSIPSKGDSGGPFIHRGHILGVTSYCGDMNVIEQNGHVVKTTNPKTAAVYTNIYSHKKWIHDTLKDKQGPTKLCFNKHSDKKYCKL